MVIMTIMTQVRKTRNHAVAEIKARFSEFVREAERGEPVVITRNGKPVAALVGTDELERLQRLRAAGPEAGLASVAGGWEGSDELVTLLADSRRTKPRKRSNLD